MKWDSQIQKELPPFDCGDEDLNDFFAHEAVLYADELLGKTYLWATNEEPHCIVAAFTVSNDSIKSKLLPRYAINKINRPISNHKRGRTYPAVLIGRLGVAKDFQGDHRHVGSQVVDFLKDWFSDEDNRTGCRFLVVDAYNSPGVLAFYDRCGFRHLYRSEDEERDFYGLPADEPLRTRMMYFDLK